MAEDNAGKPASDLGAAIEKEFLPMAKAEALLLPNVRATLKEAGKYLYSAARVQSLGFEGEKAIHEADNFLHNVDRALSNAILLDFRGSGAAVVEAVRDGADSIRESLTHKAHLVAKLFGSGSDVAGHGKPPETPPVGKGSDTKTPDLR